MGFEFVDVKHRGRITVVTLNRPGVMNALHKPAHFELHEVFNAFAADADQWVAIVTGAGDRAFLRRQRPEVAGGGAASVAGTRADLAG